MSKFDTLEARGRIQGWFPSIAVAKYDITSEQTIRYNCVAWAAGYSNLWWEAVKGAGYYWPKGVPENDSVSALTQVYASEGFTTCADGDLEEGFEKVAIYADQFGYTHASRQFSDGRWTSKLGRYEDVTHGNAYCLCGTGPDEYGHITTYMRRSMEPSSASY